MKEAGGGGSTRVTDWSPLTGGDPCPGDPDGWTSVGNHWYERANAVDALRETLAKHTVIDADGKAFGRLEKNFSGVALEMPDHWSAEIAPDPALVMLILPSEEELAGVSVVVTLEQPPADLQDLSLYTRTQRAELNALYQPQGITPLGLRRYELDGRAFELAVHSFTHEKAVLASFQVFAFSGQIATAVTVTVPLVLMEMGWELARQVMGTLTPASHLYRYSTDEEPAS